MTPAMKSCPTCEGTGVVVDHAREAAQRAAARDVIRARRAAHSGQVLTRERAEALRLRVEHPEATLRELARLAKPYPDGTPVPLTTFRKRLRRALGGTQ